MTMKKMLKVTITATLLCALVGVVALLAADGAANWGGIITPMAQMTPDEPKPSISKPGATTKPMSPLATTLASTPTLHQPVPVGGPPSGVTLHPPVPANPLGTPTLHRPIPANPLKTPTLYPPFPTVGPTAGEPICNLVVCVKVTP